MATCFLLAVSWSGLWPGPSSYSTPEPKLVQAAASQSLAVERSSETQTGIRGTGGLPGSGLLALHRSTLPKPIEEIRVGDVVLAWDEAQQRNLPRRVLRIFRNTTDHVHHIRIQSEAGQTQVIGTTCGHPFWVRDQGWTDAAELRTGDRLVEPGQQTSTIVGHTVEHFPAGIATFNFEVEGSHTYYALADAEQAAILVHNASRAPRQTKLSSKALNLTKLAGKSRSLRNVQLVDKCSFATDGARAPRGTITDITSRTVDEVNAPYVAKGWNPPYGGSLVREFTAGHDIDFVRVHGSDNKARSWIMRPDEVKGLTPEQINWTV